MACMYEGMAELLECLQETADIRFGIITRNITHQPLETLRLLFKRHGVNSDRFDFLVHLPFREEKVNLFRKVRRIYDVNPVLSYACGDEVKDYVAAIQCGMHPLMVSYGFENYMRLHNKFDVPAEVISRSPAELSGRLLHALGVQS